MEKEMEKRKERIEAWRAERRKKNNPVDPAVEIKVFHFLQLL